MKALFFMLLTSVAPLLYAQAQQQHNHTPVDATPAPLQTPAVATPPATEHLQNPLHNAAMQEAEHMNRIMHGDSSNWLLMMDRFEYADDSAETLQWEAQGWYGKDERKLWFKTEGKFDRQTKNTGELEVQLLYSRAVAPFWDVQFGLRHDDGESASRAYAVLGIQGLAPNWFEVDAAAFVSEQGRLSTRMEVEYDLRFTQRLILQPRLELGYAFADDAARSVWQGLHDASFGLRLRYEILREFAPYAGVEWWQAHGRTGSELKRSGQDSSEFRVVAGVRLWY